MEIRTGRFYRCWDSEILDGYTHFYTMDSGYEGQSIVDITYIINHIKRAR